MRKWHVTLPGNKHFEMESDTPRQDLISWGFDAFALEEITKPERPRSLTVTQAAKLLGVSTKTMYDLTHRADFPTIKLGCRTVILEESLWAWMRNQEQNRKGGA